MENVGAILEAPNSPFELASWQMNVQPGDVVIDVELCGLCGSDLHVYRGQWTGSRYPVLLGHEFVGRVVRCPVESRDILGRPLRPGDRVVLASSSFGECSQCYTCAEVGTPWLCPNRSPTDVSIDGRRVATVGGGLARRLLLTPPRARTLIRTTVSPEAGVFYEPLTVAVRMVLDGPPVLGADVVVQGTGAIGLLTILTARAAGAATVIAVGGPRRRLELARQFGADILVDIDEVPRREERVTLVRESTAAGLGASVGYEIAGAPNAVVEGLAYLRPSGVLMEAGNAADTGSVSLNPNVDLQRDARTVVGVRGRELRHFTIAGHLLERFAEDLPQLATHQLPLDRVTDGLLSLGGGYELDGAEVVKVAIDPQT